MSPIDIPVVYTPAARRFAGGTAEIETEIDLRIAETNQAYLDGGVNQRLVLVAREEVEYTEAGNEHTDLALTMSSPSRKPGPWSGPKESLPDSRSDRKACPPTSRMVQRFPVQKEGYNEGTAAD